MVSATAGSSARHRPDPAPHGAPAVTAFAAGVRTCTNVALPAEEVPLGRTIGEETVWAMQGTGFDPTRALGAHFSAAGPER
jgi:hypothetical protein